MASVENFFKSDPPHGLVKRLVLKKYLQAYIPIMLPESKPENKLRIVDGFAGTGRYEDYGWPEEIEKYGSPIIALHVAIQHLLKLEFKPSEYEQNSEHDKLIDKYDKKLANLHRTTMEPLNVSTENIQTLSLIYVEADEKNYRALFKNVMQTLLIYGLSPHMSANFGNGVCIILFDHPSKSDMLLSEHLIFFEYRFAITLFCAEFKQLQAPPSPSFAFIDPYGYSYTPFDKIRDFVGYGKEIVINLMTSYINRFICAKPERVGKLFGISAQEITEWKESLAETDDKILNLVDKYQNRLKDACAGYTVNFEMRGLNNARIYHLIFATNHVRGLEVMKESMNRGTQETNRFCSSDYQIIKKGKPISFLNDQKDKDVADAIHRNFSGRTITISTVENFILFDTLYVFRKKPLAVLEKAEKMKVIGPSDRLEKRKKNTYPDDTTPKPPVPIDWVLQFKDVHIPQFTKGEAVGNPQ